MKWIASAAASVSMVLPASAQVPAAGPVAVADHIALHVADAEKSAAFYRRAFSLRDVPTTLPNTRWLALGETITLHLIGGRTASAPTNRFVHFAVPTANLDQSIRFLDANEIAWSDFAGKANNIQTRFDGVRQIFVQDPDGYWVEINDTGGERAP